MLRHLLALVTFGSKESKGEREAPCSQKLHINNDSTIFNRIHTRLGIMYPKTCSQPISRALRSPFNPFRCSMLPFDKGSKSLINILVRYGVPFQCRSNYHLEPSIRPPPKLQSTCFDERLQMEPWPQDMMEVLSSGRRGHMP